MNEPDKLPIDNAAAPGLSTPPPVVRWYKLYAGFMVLAGLLLVALGIYLRQNEAVILSSVRDITPADIQIRATVTLILGVVFALAFIVALLLPRSPGAWVYHIVMIAFGLGNCCLWLATIPLMLAWLKPETQRWFGRNVPGVLPQGDEDVLPPTA